MLDKLKAFLTEKPQYFGIFFILIGIGGLVSAIVDAHWLFGDVSGVTYNLKKIDGWVNFFGRKPARVISGVFSVFVIFAGIFWFWAYTFYYKK
jgi:hypothetical protein